MSYHSQFGEDKFIAENLLLPEQGFFIEVGAFDGVASSNTLAFEELGWKGICIEPDPEIAARCRANRKALTFTCAIGQGEPYQKFWVNNLDRGTSGLRVRETGNAILAPVYPLYRLIQICDPPAVDLLSVDTEGSEVEVLETVAGFHPRIIIAEFWSQPKPPDEEPLRRWFSRNGYGVVHRTQANLIAKAL